ncbi:MAG: patatin-like phospholipase family protein [Elusimicrobiota bacterium]|nr:patatin-like phospholipase family protein [Elusimicrobiota bacterium]
MTYLRKGALVKKFKVGIALGGGGARGLAHIGILEVLGQSGLAIDAIAGTSMGAVVGALYAAASDARAVEKNLAGFISSKAVGEAAAFFSKKASTMPFGKILSAAKQFFIMNRAVIGPSIISSEQIEAIFSELHLPGTFDDLKIPFCSVATDIGKGDEKIFSSGNLKEAVLASSSIPGIFPPVKIDGSYYLDGGTVNSVPVSPLKPCCDFVIACDARPVRKMISSFERGLAILSRTDAISSYKLSDLQIEQADFIIKPDTSNIHWADFKKMDYCIEEGRDAAKKCLKELQKAILWAKINSFPRRLFSKNVKFPKE